MKKVLQLGLRSGERLYINGAVIRVDRKVRVELLNDVKFLLEAHVMQSDAATTPIRQLYFLIQGLLMDPSLEASLLPAIGAFFDELERMSGDEPTRDELGKARAFVHAGKCFDALKSIRVLMQREDAAKAADGEVAIAGQEAAA